MSKRERFIESKCDRCGKATPARQNDIGDLYVLPHEWPAPLADQGGFCQRCIERYNIENWLAWFQANRPAEPTPETTPASDERIPMACPNCGGHGSYCVYAVSLRYRITCPTCGGTGIGYEVPRATEPEAEMLTCEVCGELRSDCVNQTPANEEEVADINVCQECIDALQEEMEVME